MNIGYRVGQQCQNAYNTYIHVHYNNCSVMAKFREWEKLAQTEAVNRGVLPRELCIPETFRFP